MHRLIRGASPLVYLGSVLTAALLFMTPLSAICEEGPSTDTIITQLRDAVYGHALAEEALLQLHETTLDLIRENISEESEAAHARALANYYLGRWYQALKSREEMALYAETLRNGRYLALRRFYTEREPAMAAYQTARADAELYLVEQPGAEAHRLYGEILGQMLFLGDAGDIMSIGGKARKNVKKALKIDPLHTKAMIQEASRMAYTPLSYGGDPDGARGMYRDIMRNGGIDSEDLFNIYGGFAMADFMEEKDEGALAWFEEAAAIFPGNIFASGMSDYLRRNLQ